MTVTTGLCQNSIAWHQQSTWLPRTRLPYAKNTFNYLMCLETSIPRAHGLERACAMKYCSRFYVHKDAWHATVRCFYAKSLLCVGISDSFLVFQNNSGPGLSPRSRVWQRAVWDQTLGCVAASLSASFSHHHGRQQRWKNIKLYWFCCQQHNISYVELTWHPETPDIDRLKVNKLFHKKKKGIMTVASTNLGLKILEGGK